MGSGCSRCCCCPRESPSDPRVAPARKGGAKETLLKDADAVIVEVQPETGPVHRAVSLKYLLDFTLARHGTLCSWEAREYMPATGVPGSTHVTADTLAKHRKVRLESPRERVPTTVSYTSIPFEEMYTTDIVECVVRSIAREKHQAFATAQMPAGSFGTPTYFISHAWGSPFVDLVESIDANLAGAAGDDTFLWLDIFAINQDDSGGLFSAMEELDDGKTLARVIELSRATKVIMDNATVAPLSRLWCLYEIGSCPQHKLQLVTHGFSERDISQHFQCINAETAQCFSEADKIMIRGEIVRKYGSLANFTNELRLRSGLFLLLHRN